MRPLDIWLFFIEAFPDQETVLECAHQSWHKMTPLWVGDAELWSCLSLYFFDDVSADMEHNCRSGSHAGYSVPSRKSTRHIQ